MIRYCRRYDLKVATRGQAHTMFGQSLSPGLVIESGSLNRIHSIGPEGADVDAGVRWKALLIASFDHGLTPSVLTGYTNLSIGGTLSVGGMSGRNYAGAQVDHVRELEVVTGVGNVHRCSDGEHNVDVLIDSFQANVGWNDLIKPWYDLRRGHAGAQQALVRKRARPGCHAVSDQRDRVQSGGLGAALRHAVDSSASASSA